MYRDWQAAAEIPTPQTVITIAERQCVEAGAQACTHVGLDPMIMVYPDPTWILAEPQTPERIRDMLAAKALFYHELGHVRDHQKRQSRRYRERFAQIMGWRLLRTFSTVERAKFDDAETIQPDVYQGWNVCVYVPSGDCADPGEYFAMANQWCSIDSRNRVLDEWNSGYGYAPNLGQHRAACELLAGVLS